MNRELRSSNLSKYRVPLDIDNLYEMFVSHSYEARRAMLKIHKYHQWRKGREALFSLDGTDQSYAEFGGKVGIETRSAHVWI